MIMPLCGQKIDSMFCSNSIIISLAFDFLASLRAIRKLLRSRLVEDEPEEMPENEGATELLEEPEEPEPVQQVEEEDPIRTASSRGVRFH